jgi:hypothetical protein
MPLRAAIGTFGGEKSRPANGAIAPTIAAGGGDKIGETSADLKAPDSGANATADGDTAVNQPVTSNAKNEAAPSVNDRGKFAALFDEQLPLIVRGLMPPSAALGVLQNAAFSTLTDASETRGFIQYAKERLSGLTAGECMRLQLEPQQYYAWRRQYFPEEAAAAAAARNVPVTPAVTPSVISEAAAPVSNRRQLKADDKAGGAVANVLAPAIEAAIGTVNSSAISTSNARGRRRVGPAAQLGMRRWFQLGFRRWNAW